MNKKNEIILGRFFANPIPADIVWTDIELLFLALGATLSEGRGSRVRAELHGERAVFHRPHPEKTTDKGAVRAVRRFLINAGVRL